MATDTQKKSFFGGLKSLIVEEMPEQKKEIEKTVARPPPPSAPRSYSANKPDPAATEKLEKMIQNASTPAYSMFTEQFQNLADVIPEEYTRVKAALKASKTTIESVVSGIDLLMATLQKTKDDFQSSLKNETNTIETDKRKSLLSTEELIASKKATITSIQEEIASLESKIKTSSEHFESELQHINSVADGFNASHDQVYSRLLSQKNLLSPSKGF